MPKAQANMVNKGFCYVLLDEYLIGPDVIRCVSFEHVDDHLRSVGFRRVRSTGETLIYRREDDVFTIRMPNVFGNLPEIIVDQAVKAAALAVPDFTTHWCD